MKAYNILFETAAYANMIVCASSEKKARELARVILRNTDAIRFEFDDAEDVDISVYELGDEPMDADEKAMKDLTDIVGILRGSDMSDDEAARLLRDSIDEIVERLTGLK